MSRWADTSDEEDVHDNVGADHQAYDDDDDDDDDDHNNLAETHKHQVRCSSLGYLGFGDDVMVLRSPSLFWPVVRMLACLSFFPTNLPFFFFLLLLLQLLLQLYYSQSILSNR
jgi:hypothetical protein